MPNIGGPNALCSNQITGGSMAPLPHPHVPKGDQVRQPYTCTADLAPSIQTSASVSIELYDSLAYKVCKVPTQLCDGNTNLDIYSSTSRSRLRYRLKNLNVIGIEIWASGTQHQQNFWY